MSTDHPDVRQHILATGQAIITRKGFTGVGLNEILTNAGVPKGSFYHYFKSKESFGEALLADYVSDYLAQMETLLARPGQSAAESLLDYWESWFDQGEGSCSGRCLVVKLAGEVADLSESMRLVLLHGTDAIVARLAAGIEQGMADGSIKQIADPAHTALTLYQLWLGAALLTKLRRAPSALQAAMQSTRQILKLDAEPGTQH